VWVTNRHRVPWFAGASVSFAAKRLSDISDEIVDMFRPIDRRSN
jgi:hypothetical protein